VKREDIVQLPQGAKDSIIAGRVGKNQWKMPFSAIVADNVMSAADAACPLRGPLKAEIAFGIAWQVNRDSGEPFRSARVRERCPGSFRNDVLPTEPSPGGPMLVPRYPAVLVTAVSFNGSRSSVDRAVEGDVP
jgi:hypothetical protein